MILQVSDFIETTEFYRIPNLQGRAADTADLEGVIAQGERKFCETFAVTPTQITGDAVEALKFFTFALWLRMQATRKTSAGAGAKVNFTQSQNFIDEPRRYEAYNQACTIMGRNDLKMLKILNH